VSAGGEESETDVSDDIDTLLDELLPTGGAVGDDVGGEVGDGLPVWSVTEAPVPLTPVQETVSAPPEPEPGVSIGEPLAGEPSTEKPLVAEPAAETQHPPPRRRATPLLIGAAALVAVVAVASLAGYWFGSRQTTDAAAPDTAADATTASVAAPSTTASSAAETSADETSTDASVAADASSSNTTADSESSTSSEGLGSQRTLDQIDTTPIGFDPGTDQLRPESLPVLLEVADALAGDATSEVEISVHTFSEETDNANHNLSHRQGDAVVAVLIEAGVSDSRLVVIGRGNEVASANPDGEVVFRPIG
jgi:outer membrane protein OmpA-like peptidoglycan-associated protein